MAQISLRVDDKVKKDEEMFYSVENATILDKRIADMKAGKNMSEHELIEED